MLRVNANGAEKLHITLQCGDEQESITLDRKEVDTMLKTLKDHVRDFADRAAPDWKEVKTYMLPTFCHFCGDLIKGVIRQGLHCKTCKNRAGTTTQYGGKNLYYADKLRCLPQTPHGTYQPRPQVQRLWGERPP
ncbi:unnamed protein product [Nippostrongylus brasiliensis]|uniref:Phorbol-ester/DAG-type domain-containing protein n=1 Tax=Nippostrongylus brasiliensis TaxID=27835 RepID=A0A158QYY4_NIPBR|nr:unnamed protein product [Nippostrongylus brasiliensis]